MKTLISAQSVRQAHAKGLACLPTGKDIMVTPEARDLAAQLGIRLTVESAPAAAVVPAPPSGAVADLRATVIAKLPPEVARRPEVVDQVVARVMAAVQNPTPARAPLPASAPRTSNPAAGADPSPGGIKVVNGGSVRLGVFPGAGADKQVGIADVITAADGSPIAAGFMAWSQCFFPWTLDYDEIDLVLEGELHIRCNGETRVGRSGDVIYIPKGSRIEFGTPTSVRFFYVTYPANWQG